MPGGTDAPLEPNQVNGSATSTNAQSAPLNPYETNPALIPKDDPCLLRSAHYGRYDPRADDFKPRYGGWYQLEPETISYWENIVRESCTEENSLKLSGSRMVYAVGSVLIKVDHNNADSAERYASLNANELCSARKAQDALKEVGVAVPVIHFCGTIDGRNVTVESRIPGVSLEAAWRYLTAEQIDTLKTQCRKLIQCLGAADSALEPSYVCNGLNSQSRVQVQKRETEILFSEKGDNENLCLVQNDFTPSNVIVRDGQVVGILGWRQSGFFGYERAKQVHREFRISEDDISWEDIYDDLAQLTADASVAEKREEPGPEIKTEASATTINTYPVNDDTEDKPSVPQVDGGTESRPTPKQVSGLKQASRASSTPDRASPVASAKTGKKATGSTKKGAAKKKPTNRKRKKDEVGTPDGRRSNTPSARSGKKQGSASQTGSPAPDGKRKRSESEALEEDEESYEDENEEFCICRKPDNHTWMIGCDGACEDWFHGKCVNIDSRDADLIDKYICPNCSERGMGYTTWKPMCRLPGCRQPARVRPTNPSKYCSDDHGLEFMLRNTQHFGLGRAPGSRKKSAARTSNANDGIGSLGGVLSAGELKAAVLGVSSAEEFRKLGDRIVSPTPEAEEPDEAKPNKEKPDEDKPDVDTKSQNENKLGLDSHPKDLIYAPDEASKLDKLHKRRDELRHRKDMLATRTHFLGLVRQRSKTIVEHLKKTDPKGGWKDICGFDSRLAWSDEEFDEWRLSEMGEKALEDGTPEALAASFPETTDADGDTAMDGTEPDTSDPARGVCTKKRCERHKQWVKVHQQEIVFDEGTVRQDLAKCEKEAQTVVERAVLRMWAAGDHAQVEGG